MALITKQFIWMEREFTPESCGISVYVGRGYPEHISFHYWELMQNNDFLWITAKKNDGQLQQCYLEQEEVENSLLNPVVNFSSKTKQLEIASNVLLKLPDTELLKFFAELVNKRTQSEEEQTTLEK